MAKEHMYREPTLLAIKEMQIKAHRGATHTH